MIFSVTSTVSCNLCYRLVYCRKGIKVLHEVDVDSFLVANEGNPLDLSNSRYSVWLNMVPIAMPFSL